jgi:hypothetical protein
MQNNMKIKEKLQPVEDKSTIIMLDKGICKIKKLYITKMSLFLMSIDGSYIDPKYFANINP